MQAYGSLPRDQWPPGASLDDSDVASLHRAHHADPSAVLGCHQLQSDSACPLHVFRVWHSRLEETSLSVLLHIERMEEDALPAVRIPMERRCDWLYEAVVALPDGWLAPVDSSGQAPVGGILRLPRYHVVVRKEQDGTDMHLHDTFGYSGVLLSEVELDQLQGGIFPSIADAMGCHCVQPGGVYSLRFAVWAPTAQFVSVVGDWNGWDGRAAPMRRRHRAAGGGFSGVWELLVPFSEFFDEVPIGNKYGYKIHTSTGVDLVRIDPFAQEFEVPDDLHRCPSLNSSLVSSCDDNYRQDPFLWCDESWISEREKNGRQGLLLLQPLAIYEVHLPSWRRTATGGLMSYRELARPLIEHVKAMNFNFVELIGLAHHPFLGSWGYQVTGYYGCFSLLGSPDDLKFLINELHTAGIGVIMDFVPAHFCKDSCGFSDFDGSPTFEYTDPREGEQREWGTKIFNFRRNEVRSFLIGAALFWVQRYHIDGFRCDAISCAIYRNFGRHDGDWLPNEEGGDSNLEAVSLLRDLNKTVKQFWPGVLMIAEESTAWEGVTNLRDVPSGLGFDLKWDLGWMNDTLVYLEEPAWNKPSNHNKLHLRGGYMQNERWIVPLSHDEVANMKGSLLDKMGRKGGLDFYDKLRLLCALYGYQAAAPGRPLLFMGQEFGQGREWNCYQSLEWHEGEEALRRGVCTWVSDLMGVYRYHRPLHMGDDQPNLGQGPTLACSFEWVESNADACVIAFCRHWKRERPLLAIFNFGSKLHHNYALGSPYYGAWEVLLNSDDLRYGGRGGGPGNSSWVWTGQARQDCSDSLSLDLPAASCMVLLAPESFVDCRASRPPRSMNQSCQDTVGGDIEYSLEDLGF
eukprot:TRINITY_DN27413_c0_g1_i1.p1 TRINITY_DN27413_c0_g1~~TRINITY_DN27413_c0_g1_i1.p1  ORF type:complete len:868 (+),score=136.37 TRINITY_DN27413_c0_g1_i1:44-2605(+)